MTDNFSDNDIMWLGSPSTPNPKKPWWKTKPFYITMSCLFVAGFAFGITAALLHNPEETVDDEPGLFEQEIEQPAGYDIALQKAAKLDSLLSTFDNTDKQGCAIISIEQDGHPLRVYYPRNATAKLFIGMRPTPDTASILSFQAADIRADNQQIVGAFVENGNVHSKGLSKRGYCGIIDGQIAIGVADDSPLYDQAIATEGYFFRQYPLVENGQAAPSQLKSESIRRGLCDVGGRIVVIESTTPILFYEFGETLSHLGVWNAIYLIGGGALGSATTLDGEQISWGTPLKEVPENINYICWK